MNYEFLKPRLTGARFSGHAIPLEFLQDLSVLEEMIVEVAKWRFLEDHPERKRSPRRFTEGIALKLTGVDDGSAIPVISLFIASVALFPPENQEYFEQARDAFIRAIAAAENNQSVTDHLPEKALSYFDRLGRSLRDGEAIEFSSDVIPKPARLTKETRRRLVLSSSAVKEMTEEAAVRGSVPEADQEKMTFQIQLVDGRRVRSPIPTQHLDTILEAFQGYQAGTRVLLQGVGKFDRSQRLQAFESLEHISMLHPRDVPARLDELRSLQDGWLEGKGVALPDDGLDWLSAAFDQHFPDDLPLPLVFPTAEGGVQAEWSIKPYELSLEIDLTKHAGDWHGLNLQSDVDTTKQLNLDTIQAWEWIARQIRTLSGGPT